MSRFFYIGSLTLMFALPFVSFINFFPFFRFGMFASSIKTNDTIEVFKILSQKEELKYDDFPLPGSTVNYLARKYYYKDSSSFLLTELHKKQFNDKAELQLIRVRYDYNGNTIDSALVCQSAL